MKAAIVKKYRLIIKTMGYVGWALFWLLLWDVAVTVDFMLFLTTKINLPLMPLKEHIATDYQTTRLSLKGHPMQILRPMFDAERVLSAEALYALLVEPIQAQSAA